MQIDTTHGDLQGDGRIGTDWTSMYQFFLAGARDTNTEADTRIWEQGGEEGTLGVCRRR
jgi:hypothetical protein